MSAKVLIAIQARLTNTRLPGKCRLKIAGIPILERVITAAKKCQFYINSNPRGDVKVEICLLVPKNDGLAEEYKYHCQVIEGSENDVLSRYYMALKAYEPDYIVRITGDCPLIPPHIIQKHIINTVKHNYDYVSNVDPKVRTAPDGWDCEVISKRLMEWVHVAAETPHDREHVTTLIRSDAPTWAEIAHIIGYVDESHLKLSVDTKEDYEFICTYHDILTKKISTAKETAKGIFRL